MTISDKTLTLKTCMNMRASELGIFLHFHILKLLKFLQYSVGTSDTLSQKHIFSGLKLQSAWYIYHQCSSLLLLMVWRYTNDSIPTKQWHWENLWICERAWKILHFHILKLLFPSIFCWYFWYFFSETLYFQVSNCNLYDTYNHQCSSLLLLMVWRYTNDSIPTKHYITLRKSVNMQASAEHFCIFTF